jgi:hypothetical protein
MRCCKPKTDPNRTPPGNAERVAISRERLPTQEEGFSVVMSFFEVDLPAQHPVAVRRLG